MLQNGKSVLRNSKGSYHGSWVLLYHLRRVGKEKKTQIRVVSGKNKKVAHEAQLSVSLMFLPHFDVLCNLLLNRRTATWNLFVLYNKELKKSFNDDIIYRLSSDRS